MRTASRIHSVALLPIVGTGIDDYALLGLTDSFTNKIGTVTAVRPTSSVLRYNGVAVDPVAVGRDQNVDAVITGILVKERSSIAKKPLRWSARIVKAYLASSNHAPD